MTSSRSAVSGLIALVYAPTASDMIYGGGGGYMADHFAKLRTHLQNSVIRGCLVGAPTTPSTQAVAAGNTVWRVNVDAGLANCGGVSKDPVAVDHVIHTGSQLVAAGQSCMAALVLKNVTGTVSLVSVKGAAATTGAQVAPTDAAIRTAVGAGNPWIRIAHATINRTADDGGPPADTAHITQTQDNTKRPLLAVNVETGFGNPLT